MLSNIESKWFCIVCESEACPSISSKAGSDTKKNRGNMVLFFSKYPLKLFWHSSNCSCRWGKSCLRRSSPTQQDTTPGVSWALCIIFCQDLSILEKRLASFGSCFAISPPTNTASKYTHMFCTSNHRSRISFVLCKS